MAGGAEPRGAAPAVELRSVEKRYGDVVAVSSLSLSIRSGELVTLLGPSGCGKTTTLRMIAGLELATAGTIHIDGEDVTRLSATARDVSMVFQSYALFPHMSVRQNVAYGLLVGGMAKRAAFERAEAVLDLVGLQGFGDRLPAALSGGQQQRVALARALVLEPKVLLFDEPLSNLDAKLRRRMREEIRALQRRLGFTAVYVTHDQEEALSVSDRVVLMDRAEIVQEGSPRDLYDHPKSVFAATFIGESNIVDGVLVQKSGETAEVHVGALRLSLPHRGFEEGAVKLSVRPWSVEIAGEGDGIAAVVKKATYLGDHMEYTVASEPGELFAVAEDVARPFAEGQLVRIRFREAGVSLVEA